MSAELYIVFNIDTEGPATEPLRHIFWRVKNIYGLDWEPTYENLARLQSGDVDGLDEESRLGIRTMLSPDRLEYIHNWEEMTTAVEGFFSDDCRKDFPDSYGDGYTYSFYIRDLVDYDYNPRRKPIGYHQVYDFYAEQIDRLKSVDKLYWHFHAPGNVRHAYLDGLNISHTNHHVQVLARRVLDRADFPACFRPGMDHVRPDHNMFLELWVPFDYSNQGAEPTPEELSQKDNSPGRFGDWRRAPRDWSTYHPDFYDYQKPGSMRRVIARNLYTRSRFRGMTVEEVHKAIARVESGENTIMSFSCHDSRDMRNEVVHINGLLREACGQGHPVPFRYVNAVDAMRLALELPFEQPPVLEARWNGDRFEVGSDKPLWGPQPFFCFMTWDHRYYHDNLDFVGENEWSYTFDWQTMDKRALAKVAVASNDAYGNTTVLIHDMETGRSSVTHRNSPADNVRDVLMMNG